MGNGDRSSSSFTLLLSEQMNCFSGVYAYIYKHTHMYGHTYIIALGSQILTHGLPASSISSLICLFMPLIGFFLLFYHIHMNVCVFKISLHMEKQSVFVTPSFIILSAHFHLFLFINCLDLPFSCSVRVRECLHTRVCIQYT